MTKPRTVPQDGARSRPDPAGGGFNIWAVRRGRDAENATTEGKMISTCATCRWSKEGQLMPGWLICAPPLPPMLRRPAEMQPMSVRVNEWCVLWTERPDVERG